MSAPSTSGRPSTSSEPSAASSHTLHSGFAEHGSGNGGGNGEGSSSQRPGRGSGHHSGGMHAPSPDRRSQYSGSPLAGEAIEEKDFAMRQQRKRRSGGFLLDGVFGAGGHGRRAYNGASGRSAKEHQSSHHSTDFGHGDTRSSSRTGNDTSKHVDGGLQVDKTRKSTHERAVAAHERHEDMRSEAPQPAIDPHQIVHMALNLSESRRRNLSAGQLLASQSRAPSRAQQGGSLRAGSLRQYLNEQRRLSRNTSPGGAKSSQARHMSSSMQRSTTLYINGRPFNPSSETLARRDKAVAFFELRTEYLRLLELLPPLKPDASEPANFIVSSNNVPGSPHAHMTRAPSHAGKRYDLGRQYNPLQLLRNRRTRVRERRPLDPSSDGFSDLDQVRAWVNTVERSTQHPEYRRQDGVTLPTLHTEAEAPAALPKPMRPHTRWTFSAEELLADAYWLESADNKTLIEDRHGRRMFPPKEDNTNPELLQPRPSGDYPETRRKSWVESIAGTPMDHTTGDESETFSERGRKRKLLPTFRGESPRIKKHGRTGSRLRIDNHTDTSDSESDARKMRLQKPRIVTDLDDNTGPLALRMRALMEQEAKEAQAKGKLPAMLTPDTPNKWGRHDEDAVELKPARSSIDAPKTVNGSANATNNLGLKPPPQHRTRVERPASEPRSSFESYDSATTGNRKLVGGLSPLGDEPSPPSRAGSEKRKAKKHRLDLFRFDESSKGNKGEPESAISDKRSSKFGSEDAEDGLGISSAILSAPGAVKNLLHRKNDSVSSLNSPARDGRKEHRDSREPPSAVTRFFKGVKTEGSKVGEFIFRKDRPAEDTDADTASDNHTAPDSDSDDEVGKRDHKRRPNFARSTTATTAGSVTSKETGRYHLDLPTFRSSNIHGKSGEDRGYATDSNLADHHITRQARERAGSRSPRFDQLAPPKMDLSRISSNSSISDGSERIERALARPGGVNQLPVTALGNGNASHTDNRKRSTSRPTLDGKRHWSITDEDGGALQRKAHQHVVTQADIERIRALFLCSGVKAKEIARRAYEVRPQAPDFLTQAARTANARLYPVNKKEEHVLAAHLLVTTLNADTRALHASADRFRSDTASRLSDSIAALKARVESDLVPRVRAAGDQAIVITSDVAGAAPLAVKQINDEVDRLLRMRKRRMRYLRRVGWTALEWALVGFMWCAWLCVTVVAGLGRCVGIVWRVVRWLLWL